MISLEKALKSCHLRSWFCDTNSRWLAVVFAQRADAPSTSTATTETLWFSRRLRSASAKVHGVVTSSWPLTPAPPVLPPQSRVDGTGWRPARRAVIADPLDDRLHRRHLPGTIHLFPRGAIQDSALRFPDPFQDRFGGELDGAECSAMSRSSMNARDGVECRAKFSAQGNFWDGDNRCETVVTFLCRRQSRADRSGTTV